MKNSLQVSVATQATPSKLFSALLQRNKHVEWYAINGSLMSGEVCFCCHWYSLSMFLCCHGEGDLEHRIGHLLCGFWEFRRRNVHDELCNQRGLISAIGLTIALIDSRIKRDITEWNRFQALDRKHSQCCLILDIPKNAAATFKFSNM